MRLRTTIKIVQIATVFFVCLNLIIIVAWLGFGGAIRRYQTDSTLNPLASYRMEDYWQIAESLQQARDELGRWPSSLEEWREHETNVDALLAAPPGAPGPYEVRFSTLEMNERGVLIADPGLDPELIGFRFAVRWRMWPSYRHHLVYDPSEYPPLSQWMDFFYDEDFSADLQP